LFLVIMSATGTRQLLRQIWIRENHEAQPVQTRLGTLLQGKRSAAVAPLVVVMVVGVVGVVGGGRTVGRGDGVVSLSLSSSVVVMLSLSLLAVIVFVFVREREWVGEQLVVNVMRHANGRKDVDVRASNRRGGVLLFSQEHRSDASCRRVHM
jgi:hypothetical protein